MRKEIFWKNLSLLVAFVFLLTTTGLFVFAAAADGGTFKFKTPNFYANDTASKNLRELTVTFSAPNEAGRELKLEITGSSVTVNKFYLTTDKTKTGSDKSVTSAALTAGVTSTSAIFYIGVVGKESLRSNEFITVSAIYTNIPESKSFTNITVKSRGGGGSGGGGGGGSVKPKPAEKPKDTSTPAKPGTGTSGRFNDVRPTDWFYNDVEYVVNNGLFTGVSANAFAPRTPMTRGMIVTVLGRLSGADANAHTSGSFKDVAAGQYYTAYIEWAKANGIVNGVGDKLFAPNMEISRQDLAVILLRYANFAKKTLPATRKPISFSDEAKIAGYAKNAIQTLYSSGIINGTDKNEVAPTKSATRAEVAAMLHRFVEATKK